ncbi:hypothetical protein CC80DRAFT_65616 [Byssothecium circinans]|uniref:VOC domain-containing protein n=1 Tax=Byssothecium circinans TaxID=147558 RepID=A0A6A5TVX6_9PLEO|nr:hypothetical protein CC80DRAFT_65616 [Byssothecium circinans]
MPVSHIGVTVSHLPTSCSFFLSALQPLGYRYIGQQGNQIGLGIHDADFFLCQETPGVKAGAAHIAFTAASRTAVRDFYTAALTAGGRPNGAPASRSDEDGHFNAAILDLDGNSIEVVYKNGPDVRDDGTVIHHSRVITWQRTVSENIYDNRSVVSGRSMQPTSKPTTPPSVVSKAPSTAPSVASKAASTSEPVTASQGAPTTDAGDGAAKKIIGTLIGAAAGAAVVYAMVKSEQDSAKKEADFNVLKQAKNMVSQLTQTKEQSQPQLAIADPQPVHETQPSALHRNNGDTESQYSAPPRSVYAQRAIEPAPSNYHSATYSLAPPRSEAPRSEAPRQVEYAPAYSVAPSRTQVTSQRSRVASEAGGPKAVEYVPAQSVAPSTASHRSRSNVDNSIEYIPAASVAPSVSSASSHRSRTSSEYRRPKAIEYAPATSVASPRSHFSSHRSVTSPELSPGGEKARSTVSKAHSTAPSTLISSFVPDIERRSSEGSVVSKAKSHTSHRSSRSKHESRAPSPPPSKAPSKVASKAASFVGSILGRDAKSNKDDDDLIDDFEIDDFNDTDTVAPSDSISNAGSRRSHRSHRSSRHGSSADSSISKHSSSSKHSKSSRSHHSSSSSSKKSHRLPTIISEPSDASTVKPIKKEPSSSSSRAPSKVSTTVNRKDSVTQPSEYR